MAENKVRDQQLDQYKERLRKYEDKLKLNQNQINNLEQYGRGQMLKVCVLN